MTMSSRCPHLQEWCTESDKRMRTGRLCDSDRFVSTLHNRLELARLVRKLKVMRRVVPQELLPDMVLAKPVTNANGLPIVSAGTILDATMIERLRQMDLPSVYVEGAAWDSGGKTLAELEAELDHRFRHVAHDSVQQLILQALRTHLRTTHGVTPVPDEAETT
ncbi:MAG: hypothetical protein IPM58_02335 [Nitrospira sp.]|nr:hypothetical protein [Nitrospira sp.]